jgi:cation:H+ antiporter
MSLSLNFSTFILGTLISLATSWLLVSRLERLGQRAGLSDGLLGLVAAAAADAPEITASVTALVHHRPMVGAGVVLGSNVFNLAALLGLGALVAGRIALGRNVVVFAGVVAVAIAAATLAAVTGLLSAPIGLALVLAVLVPYVVVLGSRGHLSGRLRVPPRWKEWLSAAVSEEEDELTGAIDHRRGTGVDLMAAGVALAVVVGASVAMEQSATSLGRHFAIPEIVVGALVLAAVTSLPNAVAAVYLARRGRGAATLSTALNSNAINVAAGLLIPATVLGLSKPSSAAILVASWYLGLTVLTLLFAGVCRGLGRRTGWVIAAAYAVFVVVLLLIT